MFNNLVANLISNIRVTVQHNRSKGKAHYSKFCLAILHKLAEKKIVDCVHVDVINKRKYIIFDMPSYNQTYLINKIFCCYGVNMIMHMDVKQLTQLLRQYRDGIVSTSVGILYIKECLKRNVGGKLILLYM